MKLVFSGATHCSASAERCSRHEVEEEHCSSLAENARKHRIRQHFGYRALSPPPTSCQLLTRLPKIYNQGPVVGALHGRAAEVSSELRAEISDVAVATRSRDTDN